MKPETEARILAEITAERARRDGGDALDRFACFGSDDVPVHEYIDEAVYRAERTAIFQQAWLPVARVTDVAEPGAFVTQQIAGDPIAVVCGDDGVLRAFHNVCRHRGAQVLRDAQGNCRQLTCAYHGFVYGLDGALIRAPALDTFAGVDPGAVRLPPVHLDRWGGWVFVSLAPEPTPLRTFLDGLADELAAWDFERAVLIRREVTEQPFGWKVAVEAFLEPLHLPSIHARSAHPLLDFRASAMDWFGDHSRMATAFRASNAYTVDGPMGRAAATCGVPNFPGLNRVQETTNLSYLLFPATIFSLLPNHFTVFRVLPLGVDRTQFVYELYGAPSESPRASEYYESLVPGYAQLLAEDFENLPWIQRGLGDSATRAIPLSHYERRIRHFRARVREWIAAKSGSAT
jgi:phenylpropionate dioxygenase-like ring-hydroxylating dioxygenase large terminal subunit